MIIVKYIMRNSGENAAALVSHKKWPIILYRVSRRKQMMVRKKVFITLPSIRIQFLDHLLNEVMPPSFSQS